MERRRLFGWLCGLFLAASCGRPGCCDPGASTIKRVEFAYVANPNTSSVSAFSIDTGTGALARIDADPATPTPDDYPAGAGAWAVGVDPSAKRVYVTNMNAGTVTGYQINILTGALIRIDADPATPAVDDFPAGSQPFQIAFHPNGKFAYVANWGGTTVSIYAIDALTGALARIDADPTTPAVDDLAGFSKPSAVAFDISGRFAYVLNSGVHPGTVSAWAADAGTGRLTRMDANASTPAVDDAVVLADPRSIAFDSLGKYAYVTNADTGQATAFAIDASTGALTLINHYAVGGHPWSAVVDRSAKFLYVAYLGMQFSKGRVSAHAINPSTGALIQIDADGTTPALDDAMAGTPPRSVVVDVAGGFVYVAGGTTVTAFSLDTANGDLTRIGDLPSGGSPDSPYAIALASQLIQAPLLAR